MPPAYPARAGRSSGRIAAALVLLAGLASAGGVQAQGTAAPQAVPAPEPARPDLRGRAAPGDPASTVGAPGTGAAAPGAVADRGGGPAAGPAPAAEGRPSVPADGAAPAAAAASPGRAARAIVRYTVVDGRAVPDSLTGAPGDPEAGARLFRSGTSGADCRACHGPPGRGGVAGGPDLAGVGARRPEGTLRLMLVAPEVLDPSLSYHAYYAAGQRRGAEDPLHGGPRLEAGAIEDLVAWLSSLTGGAD